ncbi:MAG: cyclic pyranopterin monophosphate synthase MoaC [Treponema sp.]|jgi:cyclic pyranopterin phosphate synthase|nr:cyclic pyranopterin monophosphate synthase MoaC [Treponema sp.]
MKKKDFTHFDSSGKAVMVDVSAKEITSRAALAKGRIAVNKETIEAVKGGTAKKGDVLGLAGIAGIMGAKKTAELIPLCHPLVFDTCTVDFELPSAADSDGLFRIEASCSVKLSGKTGAEMEALTGVSTALLAIYDMCKAIDRAMVISDIRLEEKSGGRSGRYKRKK